MDFQRYERGEDTYRFIRTTIGLLGFIIFFLGAFCAFIVAGEIENYFEVTIVVGSAAFGIMTAFFCCVLHESKRVYAELTPPQETLQMKRLGPLPELPVEPQQPFWGDKDRDSPGYVREIFGYPAGDPAETTDFENDPDSDIQTLQELGRTGVIAEGRESIAEASENTHVKDSTCSGSEPTYEELDYTKPGPSNVGDRGSEVIESGADVSSLKCLSTLSLSDTTEKPAENVSDELSKLSLDDSEKQVSEVGEEGSSSTHSESKSQEQQAETSKDAEDVKPTE